MKAYKIIGGQVIQVDECEFTSDGLRAVMAFVWHNTQNNRATVFEIVPTELWLHAAHTAESDGSLVR